MDKPIDSNEELAAAIDDADIEIKRLAKLPLLEYERVRKETADKLGVRASILDKIVNAARPNEKAGQGRSVNLVDPEPWDEPVDGVELISELSTAIRKYVIVTKNDALSVSLWVLHCYCYDAFTCTPRLAITAPAPRCGKTTLLDVISVLAPRSLSTQNISMSATFRMIEASRPILIIDEADTFLGANEELRGILNSGHRIGGQVIRTVGDDFEPKAFSTHCPVAIAQIGALPATLADRSIHISMKRRAPGEKVARFREGKTPDLVIAARKAARWMADNKTFIRNCDPKIPEEIFNRAADNWAPLLAVAEAAGAAVSTRTIQVALAACKVEEEQGQAALLMSDIRSIFSGREGKEADLNPSEIRSIDLVSELVAMSERPWGECNRGKAMTQNLLARKLKPFGIFTRDVGPKTDRAKGYAFESFADSFARYIPSHTTSHDGTQSDINNLNEKQSAHQKNGCAVVNCDKSLNLHDVFRCVDETHLSGEDRESDEPKRRTLI